MSAKAFNIMSWMLSYIYNTNRTFNYRKKTYFIQTPFLTLIAMRMYGRHYKINGPPVNVPAKLDKIVEMLPRMPNELKLIPLKLKHKLEYKSYYMFDVV